MAEIIAPTLAAAKARIAAVQPADYARTRNALDGAVSGLSPYITHGFVTLADVLAVVTARHALDIQHKFVRELGWRAYFRHVWQHRGDAILRSLHERHRHHVGALGHESEVLEIDRTQRQQLEIGVRQVDSLLALELGRAPGRIGDINGEPLGHHFPDLPGDLSVIEKDPFGGAAGCRRAGAGDGAGNCRQ